MKLSGRTEKIQLTDFKIDKIDITRDPIDIKRIMSYYEQLYANNRSFILNGYNPWKTWTFKAPKAENISWISYTC